jgi:cytochrome c oxidase subunit 2
MRNVGTLLVVAIALAGCSTDSPSVLDTAGPSASRVERLFWVMITVAAAVFVLVVGLIVGAIRRRSRPDADADAGDTPFSRRLVLHGGIVMPVVVLSGVFLLATLDLRALSVEPTTSVEIHVTGHQWWWDVEYPDAGVRTANEIHVPTGTDIRFVLESADVIHSFWIPQAGPKRDMIPGQTNTLYLSFDRAGTFRGVCAEFCGVEHARMQMLIVAEDPADFDAWLAEQARPATSPSAPDAVRGRDVFVSASCTGCHAVRGVSEAGVRGPDLTHLASRSTIAAGSLPFDHDTLTAWVRDPEALKPGVLMPPAGLDAGDLADLVAYLEGLR